MSGTSSKSSIRKLNQGSLVRVILPNFEGKNALGTVSSFQVLFIEGCAPYLMIWVEMLIDGHIRPFELENIEILPRINNGYDQEYIADLMKAA
jgi:hypothetical protein